MSYYFADKPEYFNFLQALEVENDKYRELHQMYAKLAKKSDDEYKHSKSHYQRFKYHKATGAQQGT